MEERVPARWHSQLDNLSQLIFIFSKSITVQVSNVSGGHACYNYSVNQLNL
jgi:hypothetical protein